MMFNSRSLVKKVVGVIEFLQSNNCDICLITEAWIKATDTTTLSKINCLGYKVMLNPRKGRRGGGICALYKGNLEIKKCKHDTSYKSFELLEVVIQSRHSLLRISTFYRTGHMSVQDRADFVKELDDYFLSLTQKKGEKVICGDFNIHVENNVPETQDFYAVTESYGFAQLIKKPTHIAGGTLDLLFMQSESPLFAIANDTLFIYDLEFSVNSDHSFIEFMTPFVQDDNSPKHLELSYREYKHINVDNFSKDVINVLSEGGNFFTLDTESATNVLNNALCVAIDMHAPVKNVSVRKKKNRYTNDQILSLRRRRKFERRYRKYGKPSDKHQYSKLHREVCRLVNKEMNNFYEGKLETFKGNKRETYKVFKELLGKESEQHLPTHDDELKLCQDFENYFTEKIHNIRSELQSSNSGTYKEYVAVESNLNNLIPFYQFLNLSDSKLSSTIKGMNNKYCDLDPVSTQLVKDCLPSLLPFFKHIVNSSLQTGYVPSTFKKAMVIPSLKNANLDKDLLKNFRPLSNICFFAKIIERCVLDQLTEHLEKNKCLGEFQSAYRKFHSCETAITKISNDILCNLDKKQCTFLLFLDLSSAFDTVDHEILLTRLEKQHNITGTPLQWIKSYLHQRSYCIKVGKTFSEGVILLFGVPQGSILGPLLFILYISEIELIAKQYGFKIHIYADDTQLYISFEHFLITDAVSDVEHCLRDIKSWMSTNFLKLNEDKTKCLLITPSNCSSGLLSNVCISFSGNVVLPSVEWENLGVTFDSKMSMNTYINSIVSKGYYQLSNFWNIADKLTVELKLSLVTSYILPLIDYCNIACMAASSLFVHKLQKLLNSAVRFIYGLSGERRRLSITPYLQKLHILPVKYRMKYKVSLLVYKCFNDKAPSYIKDLIKPRMGYSHLRSDYELCTLETFVPNTKYGERSFAHVAPVEWNSLPQYIRLCSPIESFKKHLKSYYFLQCFET